MAFEGLKKLSGGAGVIVSPTKGDGRGNDLHDAKTGEFVEKGATGSVGETKPEAPIETKSRDFTNVSNFFNKLANVYEAPTMKNFILNRQKFISKERYITPQEKKNAELMRPYVKEMLDNSNFTICIQFDHFLSFLKDGRYKNQFETGKSHGLLSSHVRFNSSRQMFGHDLDDITLGKSLEKYGCLQAKNIKDYFEEKSGAKYGGYGASGYSGNDGLHCAMILKKANLRDRTTYCMGDSLNTGVYPQKYSQPFDVYVSNRHGKFDNLESITALFKDNLRTPCRLGGALGSGYFIEAQYHGDVTDKDVSKLVIGGRTVFNNMDISRKKELLEGCNARGIKVFVNNGKDDGLEEVKLDQDGNIYYTIYESEVIDDD